MTEQIPFGGFDATEFAENPEPRVPCVLLLDVSKSMAGRPVDELNAGLVAFKDTLTADSLASKRAEIAIVTFGGRVELAQNFVSAEQFRPPTLSVSGTTPMGEAINLAIDLVEGRKQTYRSNGVSYYRPWLFLITDGAPSDSWQVAASRVQAGEAEKAFVFFAVGVEGADLTLLKAVSKREPLKLKGVEFRKLFLWLSQSMQSVSRSSPGGKVSLPSPRGWTDID